jgi:hypothetical protein
VCVVSANCAILFHDLPFKISDRLTSTAAAGKTGERNILMNFKQWMCITHYHNSDLATVLAGKFIMTSVLFYLNHLQVVVA